jgi:hypothetical protein
MEGQQINCRQYSIESNVCDELVGLTMIDAKPAAQSGTLLNTIIAQLQLHAQVNSCHKHPTTYRNRSALENQSLKDVTSL